MFLTVLRESRVRKIVSKDLKTKNLHITHMIARMLEVEGLILTFFFFHSFLS